MTRHEAISGAQYDDSATAATMAVGLPPFAPVSPG
jgi:hypothetical protein